MQKCNSCCENEAKHWHHIVPKSLGGKDIASNLSHLCQSCHDLIHGSFGNLKNQIELTKIGLQNAKLRGVKLGRPPGTRTNKGFRKKYEEELILKIKQGTEKALSVREIAEILKPEFDITYGTVHKIQRRYNLK